MADAGRKARFVQEAKAASSLNHPNIITIYDISQDGGVDFIAMEYVEGRTLDQIIPRKGVRLNEALKIAIQIADALARAHSSGIVHRDLKPANIMVDAHGHVKVLDFGLAKLTEVTTDDRTVTMKTEEGAILGTAAYMSPEQAEGRPLDARSDIFSFGAVLYEMVSGERAFQGTSKVSTLSAVLHAEPAPLPAEVPGDLQKLIARCLRRDPARRFQTMADAGVALVEAHEESESSRLRPLEHQKGRRWWWIWAAVLLLSVAASAVLWRFAGGSQSAMAVTVRPLTALPGAEDWPALSCDGNAVAFSWRKPGEPGYDIYVMPLDGAEPVRRTVDPADDVAAAWSPDGQTLAFARGSIPDFEIFTVPALGGQERRAGPMRSITASLAWTPDGTSLIFPDIPDGDTRASIAILDLATGEKRRFLPIPAGVSGDLAANFSEDGRSLLLYRMERIWTGDLYLYSLSDDLQVRGSPIRLTREFMEPYSFGFAGPGQTVLFSPYGRGALMRISAAFPGEPERLAVGDGVTRFSAARKVGRVAYSRRTIDSDIWRLDLKTGECTPLSFLNSTREERSAAYSPDGKRIAFVSSRSGSHEIWIASSEGASPAQLSRIGGYGVLSLITWSPDGAEVGFTPLAGSTPDKRWRAFATDSRHWRSRVVPTGDESHMDVHPSWSRHGEWIYFLSSRESGRGELWKLPSVGGEAVRVTRQGGGFGVHESADGRFLYYGKGFDELGAAPNQLWRVLKDGGDETMVLPAIKSYRSVAVSPSGIYYVLGEGAHDTIQYFDFATGKSRRILSLPFPAAYGLSLSPDGRYLLFSQNSAEESDLMLVENIR
jgi:Tol biopolymer transport system component